MQVAYEALAWGRFVDSYETAARIVRLTDHPRIGVCLDSFHILSKGHNPEAIETIPAGKIFFVQLADAPLLSMDVLSWSRRRRLFPGEGGFDLGAFMGHLVRTGYEGPVSLEIFNDTFRQSDARATAVDARRSLRWLEHETASWLGASAGGRAARMSVSTLPVLERPAAVSYVELRTDATNDMRELLTQLGFRAHGRHRTKTVELWSQGAARIVLGSSGVGPAAAHRGGHRPFGPRSTPTRRCSTAPPSSLRRRFRREESAGDEPLVGVRAPDGSEVFFGAGGHSEPNWVREFGAPADDGIPGIECVDHVNLAQPWQHFDAGVLFFHAVLDLRTQPSMEVSGDLSVWCGARSSEAPTASSASRSTWCRRGLTLHAILPQHIAFAASDVLALAEAARDRGFRPLDIPANYYDDIEARYDIDLGVLDKLRELNVLFDRDETGEFLHFYTHPIGTVFLEVVERRQGYEGYGALNAPVRLAAQYQQRGKAQTGSVDVIRHVAVFRFAPAFTAEQRDHWMALLRALPAQIPELLSISVGTDVLEGPSSHELAIVADFADLDGLDAYTRHPAHAEVLRISAPIKVSLATVDFEVPDAS